MHCTLFWTSSMLCIIDTFCPCFVDHYRIPWSLDELEKKDRRQSDASVFPRWSTERGKGSDVVLQNPASFSISTSYFLSGSVRKQSASAMDDRPFLCL